MMVYDLRDLYQQVILDHSKKPKNFRALPEATRSVEGYNPLCGDHYKLHVRMVGDLVEDIAFEGSGCAISKASASLMTEALKGKKKTDAQTLFKLFRKMISGKPGDPIDEKALGKLAAFQGVCEFPLRVKCALLAWHSLHAAIEGSQESVSTE